MLRLYACWKKQIFIRHLLRRRRHLYRNFLWCPHLSGDIKVFGVGTYSSPSFTLSKWKKIPYQTLTIEFMSSYAGVVPPFSVIRPFTHFHLALSGDSGESCAVKCSCTRQCRFTKHGEGYLQLVNLKGKFHWFFIHKHIFFPLQFTQSINKRPITKNLNVLFYCHFNKMIHSVYFFLLWYSN